MTGLQKHRAHCPWYLLHKLTRVDDAGLLFVAAERGLLDVRRVSRLGAAGGPQYLAGAILEFSSRRRLNESTVGCRWRILLPVGVVLVAFDIPIVFV